MYQANIIFKYNYTEKKVQPVIPSNKVLSSSVDHLKLIMIGKLKNDKVRKKNYDKYQKREILKGSVNIFQENRLNEYKGSKIMSARLQRNKISQDSGKVCQDNNFLDSVKFLKEIKNLYETANRSNGVESLITITPKSGESNYIISTKSPKNSN